MTKRETSGALRDSAHTREAVQRTGQDALCSISTVELTRGGGMTCLIIREAVSV